MLFRPMEINYPPVQWKLWTLARGDGFQQKDSRFSLDIRKTQESGEVLAGRSCLEKLWMPHTWGLRKPGVLGGVPAHVSVVETGWSLRSLPAQVILLFYGVLALEVDQNFRKSIIGFFRNKNYKDLLYAGYNIPRHIPHSAYNVK